MELILDMRNPMVGSKLTLKAIFKAKKAKNRTSLEHPYFGCSNKVLFLAFFALKMAFKVNFDPTMGFLVSNMSSMPSFRSFLGLTVPLRPYLFLINTYKDGVSVKMYLYVLISTEYVLSCTYFN